MGRYQQEFRQSLTEPDQYWGAAAKLIDWYTEPAVVLDRSNPPFYRWFSGGVPSTIGDSAVLDAVKPLLLGH